MTMSPLTRRFFIAGLLACVLLSAPAFAQSGKKKAAPQFSYYLLVLSYAPDFCAEPGGKQGSPGVRRRTPRRVRRAWTLAARRDFARTGELSSCEPGLERDRPGDLEVCPH